MVGLASLVIPGCHVPLTPQSRRDMVERTRERLLAAIEAGDADGVLQLIGDDGIVLPPGEPEILGRKAILSRCQELFGRFRASLTVRSEEVLVGDEIAIDRGVFSLGLRAAGGGEPGRYDGAYILILRWRAAGSWEIARAMGSLTAPATPAGPPTGPAAPAEIQGASMPPEGLPYSPANPPAEETPATPATTPPAAPAWQRPPP